MRRESALTPQLALLAAAALVLSGALAGCVASQDFDRDGTLDVDDPDDDNDGMPDAFEQAFALNPLDPSDAALDPDGDGLTNGAEVAARTDPRDLDSDNDTMGDGFEARFRLAPLDPADALNDTDGDGLSNRREAAINSSPLSTDSDNDGMPDGWEDGHGLSPTDPADAAADADGDGLSNAAEHGLSSDPRHPDSDADGMPDGWEWRHGLHPADPADAALDGDSDSYDIDGNGTIDEPEAFTNLREFAGGGDPQDPDSDGDLIPDGYEWACGLQLADPGDAWSDLDGDGVSNRNESAAGSAANANDTDGDSMRDRFEIDFGLDPRDPRDAAEDPDGDGLSNLGEARARADPHRNDTDLDGVLDGADADPARNLTLVFTLTFLNVTFKQAPSESGFDPPWELSLSVTVDGVLLGALNAALEPSGPDSGENRSVSLSVRFDVFDGAQASTLSLVLVELDLAETISVNSDDSVDLDPTGADEILEFAVALATTALSGEVSAPEADASLDGRNGESDARIAFAVTFEST